MRLARKGSLVFLPISILASTFFITWPSLASLGTVAEYFKLGQYKEARQALLSGGEGARPGEEVLWRSRLAANADEAIQLLDSSRSDARLPVVIQHRLALELAEIYFARADYPQCLKVLEPLIDGGQEGLPGEVFLLAGLTYRLVGNLQAAREMLASVRPSDQAFSQARFYLGDIGLQQGDHSLALRYFESGTRDDSATGQPNLQAGTWRALRATGKTQEAGNVLTQLRHDSPGSLSLLEINRILREEAEEIEARAENQALADSTATRFTDNSGRYSLQLGAFSDRSLALEFLRRYQELLADLRIDQVRDDRGQFLYKIRSGRYVNPARARTDAARLKRSLGIDVIVADLSGQTRYSD